MIAFGKQFPVVIHLANRIFKEVLQQPIAAINYSNDF